VKRNDIQKARFVNKIGPTRCSNPSSDKNRSRSAGFAFQKRHHNDTRLCRRQLHLVETLCDERAKLRIYDPRVSPDRSHPLPSRRVCVTVIPNFSAVSAKLWPRTSKIVPTSTPPDRCPLDATASWTEATGTHCRDSGRFANAFNAEV